MMILRSYTGITLYLLCDNDDPEIRYYIVLKLYGVFILHCTDITLFLHEHVYIL